MVNRAFEQLTGFAADRTTTAHRAQQRRGQLAVGEGLEEHAFDGVAPAARRRLDPHVTDDAARVRIGGRWRECDRNDVRLRRSFVVFDRQEDYQIARVDLAVGAGMIMSLGELLDGTAKPVYQYGAADVNPCTAARFGEMVGLYKRKHYQRSGKGNPLFNFVQAHYEVVDLPAETFDKLSSPAMARALRGAGSLMRGSGVGALKGVAKALESAAKREEKIGEVLNLYSPFTTETKGPYSCANTPRPPFSGWTV
jgi:hypothetical protein